MVKSLVFEAGVKSLSAFCEYNVLPIVLSVVSDDVQAKRYFDSPEAAGKIGSAEHGGNAIRQTV